MPSGKTKYFVSYTRADADFVLKLAKELRAAGANLWLDQLDILGGQRWDRAVEEALATCQSMIVVLSPESVVSNNVMDEVSYALEENKIVVPVLYKDCSIPFRLRRVQRIEFTTDYDAGFADLLRALGIEQPAPTLESAEAEVVGDEEINELPAKKQTDTLAEAPATEASTAYPDFIPLDAPYPNDPTTSPKERYARYRVIRSVDGRPDLNVGEQYRVKKGLGEKLIAKGYLEHVERDHIEKSNLKQPLVAPPPEPEKQIAQTVKELPAMTPTVATKPAAIATEPEPPKAQPPQPTRQKRVKGAVVGFGAGVIFFVILFQYFGQF